jgi:hypothetical protein
VQHAHRPFAPICKVTHLRLCVFDAFTSFHLCIYIYLYVAWLHRIMFQVQLCFGNLPRLPRHQQQHQQRPRSTMSRWQTGLQRDGRWDERARRQSSRLSVSSSWYIFFFATLTFFLLVLDNLRRHVTTTTYIASSRRRQRQQKSRWRGTAATSTTSMFLFKILLFHYSTDIFYF